MRQEGKKQTSNCHHHVIVGERDFAPGCEESIDGCLLDDWETRGADSNGTSFARNDVADDTIDCRGDESLASSRCERANRLRHSVSFDVVR